MALITRAMYSGYGDASGAKPFDAMHHICSAHIWQYTELNSVTRRPRILRTILEFDKYCVIRLKFKKKISIELTLVSLNF